MGENVRERFEPTSGRMGGGLALLVAAVVVIGGFVELDEGFPPWGIAAGVLFAVLAWASVLRPALWVEDRALVMRNLFETVRVPLAAIDRVEVRQVLFVRVGDRRLASSVVGRPLRKIARRSRASRSEDAPRLELDHADVVEDRLRSLVAEAGPLPAAPDDVVRRELAWLPIVVVALSALAVVVTLFL